MAYPVETFYIAQNQALSEGLYIVHLPAGGREAIDIDFTGVPALGFDKQLRRSRSENRSILSSILGQ